MLLNFADLNIIYKNQLKRYFKFDKNMFLIINIINFI